MTATRLPRRLLATAGLAGALVVGASTMTAAAAATTPSAAPAATQPVLAASGSTSNDDTGKWGLAGLTGMLGLFGYRKYKVSRAAHHNTGTSPGSSRL